MLNIQDLLNKMKLHFPRWMDIRKRVTSSDGGHLLESVAEETAEIQKAIDDFKKDFSLAGYIGREDSIVAFVYKLHIGEVDINTLAITEPKLKITEDLNTFYSATGAAYYNEGNLFFRVEDINENNRKIKYSINEFAASGIAEKMHVWNVFDEFAAFLGLERHVGETNLQLEQRTLNVFRQRTNSTESGLKNAIMNELLILDPSLTINEINISRPTPENLVKYYKEFGSVIEKLAHVNRDVYRTKRWDIDTWNYAFKSVDYIPHAWDVVIEAYQNGVGFDDDLSIELTRPDDTTNVRVTFYAESILKIQEYVKKKDIKTNIELKLTQYDNILKPVAAKYRIIASEAKDITTAPIMVECSESITGEEERYIQDIATSDMKDIQVTDKSTISADKNYKLVFSSKTDYGSMIIENCDLVNTQGGNTTETSLLTEKSGFIFNQDGALYNRNVKLYATQKHQLLSYNNIINGMNGMVIDDLSQQATMTLDVTGMANEYFTIGYNCPTTAMPASQINKTGFYTDSAGNIISAAGDAEKFVEINALANQITFNLVSGNCTIEIITPDRTDTIIKNGAGKFTGPIYRNAVNYSIKITPIGTSIVTINDVRFSQFDIDLSLETGSFAYINGNMVLPQDNANKVYAQIKTYTGYSPVVNFIHVGPAITNAKYETGIITAQPGAIRKLAIKTNCKISLVEVDAVGTPIPGGTISNYEPYCEYKSISDQAYIKLDSSIYSQIDSIKAVSGRFETIGTGENTSLYMRLRKDEVAFKVTITGKRLIKAISISLSEMLGVNPAAGDLIYANNLLKAFVIVKNGVQTLKTIDPNIVNGISAENYAFSGVPYDIGCAFVVNSAKDSIIISDSYSGRFESMYMFPKVSKTYIAYNEYKMFNKEISGVEIVDVFNPFLPVNSMMVYKVESMDITGNTNVKFDEANHDFTSLNNWAAGRKNLRIVSNIDLSSTENYNLGTMNMDKEFAIGETIPLERTYTLGTGETIELAKYIIQVPQGMAIEYKTKDILDDITTAPDFYCSEIMLKESDGFNKLKYSNIHEIAYLGTTPWDIDNPSNNTPIDPTEYYLLNDEGIIVWNNQDGFNDQNIYIVYTIKIPDYIKMDLASMYKIIEYNMEAYTEIGFIDITNRKHGDIFDLKGTPYYASSQRMTIFCDKPGFETRIENGSIIFSRSAQHNVVTVKTGYYYIDGQEYYLFANESADSVDKFMNVEFFNVDRNDGQMALNKRARNYVKNSHMDVGNIADIYNMEFDKEDTLYGISRLNAITACSSFNQWRTFGTELYLVKGYNGVGIKIEPAIANGYAFIDITNYVLPSSYISFYAQGDINAFVGKEVKFKDLSFKRSMLADPVFQIQRSLIEPNIMECKFMTEPGYKYYLIVRGSGLIDDIILQQGNEQAKRDLHIKNLSVLNFSIEEKILDGYASRLLFENAYGESNGAEIDATGTIVNSSTVDWGLTKIREFNTPQSWTRCITKNVSIVNGVLQTKPSIAGSIETEPIYIGDKRAIKNLVFEINDVLFDNMKGFTTRILSGNTLSEDYKLSSTHKDNIGSVRGEFLANYIKLQIEIPGGKIINNINLYIEYKSTTEAAPKELSIANGTFVTEVLDTHYSAKYKLQGISIESISNINDVTIQMRGAKENYVGEIWTPWKNVKLDGNLNVIEDIVFDNCRFFQARVNLKRKEAFIKLRHIDLEVV